jgi:hypothetical protein
MKRLIDAGLARLRPSEWAPRLGLTASLGLWGTADWRYPRPRGWWRTMTRPVSVLTALVAAGFLSALALGADQSMAARDRALGSVTAVAPINQTITTDKDGVADVRFVVNVDLSGCDNAQEDPDHQVIGHLLVWANEFPGEEPTANPGTLSGPNGSGTFTLEARFIHINPLSPPPASVAGKRIAMHWHADLYCSGLGTLDDFISTPEQTYFVVWNGSGSGRKTQEPPIPIECCPPVPPPPKKVYGGPCSRFAITAGGFRSGEPVVAVEQRPDRTSRSLRLVASREGVARLLVGGCGQRRGLHRWMFTGQRSGRRVQVSYTVKEGGAR